ncbi:MAG: DUF1294 domain-containing protein [Peptococcaceae bacterium]|jgi:uncharacterized membrane protein YsdA (DUF1294 family)|nr:DUF1294 domain-containing protein [Peptococcaceae bacterium]
MKVQLLCIFLIIWNIFVFLIYALDKALAKMNARRISELALLGYALIGGGLGALAGVFILRHKSQHKLFRAVIPLSLVTSAALIYFVFLKVLS